MENILEYILCHGSGNRFAMIDFTASPDGVQSINPSGLSRLLCQHFRLDGLLIATRDGEDFAMRMFNTDGSEAEMCGNGIRCIARFIDQRLLQSPQFTLRSGGKNYLITREKEVFEGIPTYGVEIGIELMSRDLSCSSESFIDQRLPQLHDSLKFSFLSLGNPHLVAVTDEIDYELLTSLGERVKTLTQVLPNGVNVSLLRRLGEREIFVATYERGVGLTNSCGTAMTASTTVASLLGLIPSGEDITVRNRGGMVRCNVKISEQGISTRLVGNATYEQIGSVKWDGKEIEFLESRRLEDEIKLYEEFVRSL